MKSISSLFMLLVLVLLSLPHHQVDAVKGRSIQSKSFRCAITTSEKPKSLLKESAGTSSTLARGGAGIENSTKNAVLGAIVMALTEKVVKEGLLAANVKFPPALGGCIFLFFAMLAIEQLNAKAAHRVFEALTPGAALLAKWLPVFFVPGLVMLPLSPSVGGSIEVVKVLGVVVIGFVYSLLTTGYAVIAVQNCLGKATTAPKVILKGTGTATAAPLKPFADETMSLLYKGTIVSGIVSVLASRAGNSYAKPLQTIFLTILTFASYVWSARLPRAFVKLVHPLVTSSALTLTLIKLLGRAIATDYIKILGDYRVKSLNLMSTGSGDVLLYLLGPSVVSFAVSMYSRRVLLKSNLLVVFTAMIVASVGGLFGTAAFVNLIKLGSTGSNSALLRLSVLARNVTTALAITLTQMIDGDIAIAASVVAVTGIVGATYGQALLNYVGIKDPIVRGLAIGSSSQGLGVAALSNEPDAFPFGAIAMVLNAISATTLASLPSVRKALVKLTTGRAKVA